jgi:hypothetical protein
VEIQGAPVLLKSQKLIAGIVARARGSDSYGPSGHVVWKEVLKDMDCHYAAALVDHVIITAGGSYRSLKKENPECFR